MHTIYKTEVKKCFEMAQRLAIWLWQRSDGMIDSVKAAACGAVILEPKEITER